MSSEDSPGGVAFSQLQNESDHNNHHVNENGKRTLPVVAVSAESPDVPTKRVKFNVGGHCYVISRHFLMAQPDTMLARSASDLWHKDPEQEIFLNGDGERFKYVLDYLRDGEVYLPFTIPKPALIKDLEYFGFQNVDTDQIKLYDCHAELAAAMIQKEELLKDDILGIDMMIAKLKRKRFYKLIAHDCFRFYCRHGTLSDVKILMDHWNDDKATALTKHTFQRAEFNEALAHYDFKYNGGKRTIGTTEKYLILNLIRIERNEIASLTGVE